LINLPHFITRSLAAVFAHINADFFLFVSHRTIRNANRQTIEAENAES
jgi:hypothetical protein